MTRSVPPKMSYVILTRDNYSTIRPALRHLAVQQGSDLLEVVIVTPSQASLDANEAELAAFHSWQVVEVKPLRSTTEARAAGIRQAKAPVVALGEDHSFPQPGWIEALVQAHAGPWAVVGPEVCNANPCSAASWANFLIEYGHWICPAARGECDHVPGHNSAYKRDVLLAYGQSLPARLDAETVMHWDLRAKGHRLYLEPKARTMHLNPSRLWPWLPLRIRAARSFAGPRARGWPAWRRAIYAAATLTLPVRSMPRLGRLARRAGLKGGLLAQTLLCLSVTLSAEAIGRFLGYAWGFDRGDANFLGAEFGRLSFLNERDRQAEAQRQPAASPGP